MKLPTLPTQVPIGWAATWARLNLREQQLIKLGGCFFGLAALWFLALAPALQTLQEAPSRQNFIDAQSQRMRQLQAQAESLQKPRAIPRTDAVVWLEKNLSDLGPNASISVQGSSVSISFEAAPARALARWLSMARENAQALPTQAQLQQVSPIGPESREVTWGGSLVLRLP